MFQHRVGQLPEVRADAFETILLSPGPGLGLPTWPHYALGDPADQRAKHEVAEPVKDKQTKRNEDQGPVLLKCRR